MYNPSAHAYVSSDNCFLTRKTSSLNLLFSPRCVGMIYLTIVIDKQTNGNRLASLLLLGCRFIIIHLSICFWIQSDKLMIRILAMILNRHHQLLYDKKTTEIDMFVLVVFKKRRRRRNSEEYII